MTAWTSGPEQIAPSGAPSWWDPPTETAGRTAPAETAVTGPEMSGDSM
ncbi:hypothetical protein [Streptomyces xanthophaeus]